MIKIVLIALSALFACVACQKAPVVETVPEEGRQQEAAPVELVVDIQVNHPGDTKAVKTGWESGDKIYVFFEDVTPTKYLELAYNGSAWSPTLRGDLLATDLTASGKHMSAVYFPYEQPVIASGGEGVTFRTGGHSNDAIDGLHIYTYFMKCENAEYTINTSTGITTLSGILDMVNPAGFVQFYINEAGGKYNADYTYRLSVHGIKPAACSEYNSSTGLFTTKTDIVAAQPMWGYRYGSGVAFSGMIDGDSWSNSATAHIVYLFDTADAAKTKTVTGKTLASHDAVLFAPAGWSAAATAPGTITAGGIKWGTFNLGATAAGTAAANYGWYFGWGDIIPARGTNISDTPCTSGAWGFGEPDYYLYTIAYEALNGNTVNLTGDYAIYDMATAFLGSPWRLPTGGDSGEFVGLLTAAPEEDVNYTWGDNNAVIVISSGITFPSVGNWDSDGWHSGDEDSFYWSSSHYDETNAYYLRFNPTLPLFASNSSEYRRYGAAVRPVQNL